jgi:hypothetical protein
VNSKLSADAKINSKQSASATLTYLGLDKDGNGRFRLVSKGKNAYHEKGNTFQILTIMEDADGEPLYAHHQRVGVGERGGRRHARTNSHAYEFVVEQSAARRLASIEVQADNNGKSKRFEGALEDAVGKGILKGIEGGIAKLLQGQIASGS